MSVPGHLRAPCRPADIIKIALLGAVFFGSFPWAFSAALRYTSAARGAIGIATIPIQTLIVAALFGREHMTSHKIISVALAFTGIVVVFGPEAYGGKVSSYLRGEGLMLLGAFSAAKEMVVAQGLGGADRQAPRDEEGDRGASAPVGGDHAPHLG